MANKVKVKLNSLATQSDVDAITRLAADATNVPVSMASTTVDYKGKWVFVEVHFPKGTDKNLIRQADKEIESLISVDGTFAYPVGGPKDFEDLTVGQEYTSLSINSGSADLDLALTSSVMGGENTCAWKGDADGQSGKALAITDARPQYNSSGLVSGNTWYTHDYQGFMRLPASLPAFSHMIIEYDMKIGAGDGGDGPAYGGFMDHQIGFIGGGTTLAHMRIVEYDNAGYNANIRVSSDGTVQNADAPLDFSSYVHVKMEVLAGQYIKVNITGQPEIVQAIDPSLNLIDSATIFWFRRDQFNSDAVDKTQKSILIDNLSLEILA